MKHMSDKRRKRIRRKLHIRRRINGTAERPRLTVFKSNHYIYTQVIDDTEGKTLVSASNVEKENRNLKKNTEDAAKLGEVLGKRMVEKGVDNVVFDRNGYPYHGILKAVADGARKAGVKF